MEAISLSRPIFLWHRHDHCCFDTTVVLRQRSKSCIVNAGRGTNDRGNIVDENMIVLRLRIKEVEMEEMGGLPATMSGNWMEWEKKYYEHYTKDICEAIGMLQMCLMDTRPSLALGILALFMLSVPLSTSVVIYNFLEVVKLFL